MKKTKKLVCLLLTCLLLCSVFMLPAGAQEQPDQAALLQVFKTYLDENDVEYKDWEELVFVEPITQSNGWTIFYGTAGVAAGAYASDRLKNYVFINQETELPYGIGLYAEKDGTVLTLKEAYETGKIDIEQLVQSKIPHITVYSVGDTDMNGEITAKDILNIQKAIAKQMGTGTGFFNNVFYDYNNDGIVDIKDVLALQKYIAKVA